MSQSITEHRFGYVALIGRPNVGKSTLINALVGEDLAIVTHKPQTTRHSIRGWVTEDRGQAVFVDTPGLHSKQSHALNQRLNRVATASISDVDVIVMVVDATRWSPDDERVLAKLSHYPGAKKILAFNKVDQLNDRAVLLEKTKALMAECAFDAVVYVSAKTRRGLDTLLDEVFATLPEGLPVYPADQFTDRPVRFLVAELIREQLMLQLHQEIPYGLAVIIEGYEDSPKRAVISALIVVGEDRHKGMVIGQKGSVLKRVGTQARLKIEQLVGKPVHLELHVKTRMGWMDDERELDQLGYAQ